MVCITQKCTSQGKKNFLERIYLVIYSKKMETKNNHKQKNKENNQTNEQTNGQANERTSERTNRRTNERTNLKIDVLLGGIGVWTNLPIYSRLQTLQEHLLEVHNLLNVSEQLLNFIAARYLRILQRLQVPLYQAVEILRVGCEGGLWGWVVGVGCGDGL